MMRREAQKGFTDGSEPFKTFDFAIESAASDGNNASIPPAYGAGTVPGYLSKTRGLSPGTQLNP
ncbi:MAG: hypothetical protein DWH99_03410 [Planctomycetota bacterium]|nr:MAG: hypothetical protein DWH99_03410 [Planctomycetota bacterium]